MKANYTVLTSVCLLACVPLAWLLLQRRSATAAVPVVRFASFNVAMNRPKPGQLLEELRGGQCLQARQIAEIVQRAEIDVLLLCEVDRDEAGEAARVLATEYFARSQRGQTPIEFAYRYADAVNTGEPSGLDLDGDGARDGPGDAWGFGAFPGQYGMVLLSRHPILVDGIRTFRTLRWSAMPSALRPEGLPDATWTALRLSSKSHWDVPIGIGPVAKHRVVHALCSHPTPPVFDGPEDRNGRRNHDEIRFWVDYLTPGRDAWIVDDQGRSGGLPEGRDLVVLGDLNCDPHDGDARREALASLLAHPRLADPEPRSEGAVGQARQQAFANASHRGDPALDTGDFADEPPAGPGNLRVDYVLPGRGLPVVRCGVLWPNVMEPAAVLVGASDHRLVWAELEAR